MDVHTLEVRTKLSARRLRYVIDHKIVPGLRLRQVKDAQGKPRVFSDDMGVAIVCAAIMLENGVAREKVSLAISHMPKIPWDLDPKQESILGSLLEKQVPAVVQFGDSQNLRFLSDDYNSGWIQPKPLARLHADYAPSMLIQLNLGKIRDQVMGW